MGWWKRPGGFSGGPIRAGSGALQDSRVLGCSCTTGRRPVSVGGCSSCLEISQPEKVDLHAGGPAAACSLSASHKDTEAQARLGGRSWETGGRSRRSGGGMQQLLSSGCPSFLIIQVISLPRWFRTSRCTACRFSECEGHAPIGPPCSDRAAQHLLYLPSLPSLRVLRVCQPASGWFHPRQR